ncbi:MULTISPECIES: complex I subunit 4 family protein [unclassified Gilliamella]|uniref:complex I subunit 4 family protein n=1 Tax=unclassified Gilliamella TaxID=2685620 RepID=UPI000810CA36|nr:MULTISPECIES: NADH-quinone oxidoreductase subunit M [Gilliamella]MCX8583088.1 NADH-quinone oxidoreductase subunit M [Gilliamella sp. B3372]MCX8584628.1 NADH-quinone oxidoreductase subunit M [Gilliamella sp. B3562]MCX8593394.1 NADH-quinone oxidoreductase subunit M [Gilliamella sp. B3367]MCX8661556.1 NADH-quinone oxidoreductase subunit M [Gilliamella sp. B2911]MCX8670434.1 NADH-quinone oxidoreductase subunit M [Gilliamella sp. B2785]
MLLWLVFLPVIGGFIGWLCQVFLQRIVVSTDVQLRWQRLPIMVAFTTILITLILAIILWANAINVEPDTSWSKEVNYDWIPLLGIHFHLLLDGLSLVVITSTLFIVLLVIIYSSKENLNNLGLFYLCVLFMTSAIMMLFVITDLFLMFFFWEAVAIPIYFLISLWGRRDLNSQRFNGANKFLIYTQISSLLMLISIVSLALINWNLTGQWTFDYQILTKTPISSNTEFLLMLGFLAAFLIRIPLVPFHNWFIEAHIESSTSGSMMISGLLLNTATFGLLRFVIPLFPNASLAIMPVISILAMFTVFYAALLAFNQTDIKKLIAYIHIALMGFVTTIIYSGSVIAFQGVVIQMIAINLAIVGMFMISGLLAECYLTRNINQFIGLKEQVRYLSSFTLFFMLAVLGIPGTANFVGNYMMLLGSYTSYSYYTILLVIGLLLLSISLIIRMQPIFYGVVDKVDVTKHFLSKKDILLLSSVLIVLIFIGLYPKIVLDISYSTVNQTQQYITAERVGE